MSLLDAAGVVTGDIWCSGAFSFESPLKDLLDSGEYTLEQLLAEDELLQELRGMHPQLIEFFSSEESVAGLIQYAILPPEAPPPKSFSSVSLAGEEGEKNGEENKEDTAAGESGENGNDTPSNEETNAPSEQQKSEGEDQQTETEAKEPGKWLQGEDPVDESLPVTQQTEQEEKDALYVRFPYMACEVICCEIKGIIDILVDGFVPASMEEQMAIQAPTNGNKEGEQQQVTDPRGTPILDLLFSILYNSKPGEIDDYRAGYFDKILSVLFRKRPQAMSDYINEGGGRGGPVLMGAMLKHLYSHSVMQIVQRLLLPQPPILQKMDGEDDDNPDGEDFLMEGVDIDGLGAFRCNWSESEQSLDMLLDCLIGTDTAPEIVDDEERKLSLYQNASEVLITIIQNSPLTSPTLHSLTSDPVLGRLILAATKIEDGSSFSHHDSRLTCAMNVLESLILQLGGYGSVGTMMFPDEDEGEGDEAIVGDPVSGDGSSPGESGEGLPNLQQSPPDEQNYATSDTLIQHLPSMLSSLSHLLLYPGAESWVSPMQFSKTEPQKILGSSRLRIVRLLESMVLLGDPNVDALLCDSDCLEICLDLFWKFQWCSMLHQSVANLLVHVFEGQNARSELQSYFLVKCNLLGRLMNSFWEGTEECIASPASVSNAELSQNLMALKDGDGPPPPTSVASDKGSSDDILPVSDDDVDAAMEQQEASVSTPLGEQLKEPEQNSSDGVELHDVPDHAPPQSFRLGYMGHVIIICQALVHACTTDGKSESPSLAGGAISEEMNGGELENFVNKFSEMDQQQSLQGDGSMTESVERGRTGESVATEETPSVPLILAQLVDTHPLSNSWQEFVSSTLASETAIQSTPLGGFQGPSPGMDPLHAHRPGLAEDDGFDDDDGAAPALPPRGLLVGGDVIDMDDNDLDVAASMMAGLSLRREGADGHRDLLSQIPQSNGPPQGGYMFDDPLGDGRFGKFEEEDDNSSSDEESELSGNTGDSGSAVFEGNSRENSVEDDAPVMDLFAGNFDAFGEKDAGGQVNGAWSDFANFDDAFAGTQNADDNPFVETKSNFDDVFAEVKDHAMLLEELDNPPTGNESPQRLDFEEGEVLSRNPATVEQANAETTETAAS